MYLPCKSGRLTILYKEPAYVISYHILVHPHIVGKNDLWGRICHHWAVIPSILIAYM